MRFVYEVSLWSIVVLAVDYATLYTGGLGGFVTSTAAGQHLFTAHHNIPITRITV